VSPALAVLLADLEKAIAEVATEEIPAVTGELERMKTILLGRMISTDANNTNGQPAPAEEDRLLTPEETAARLGIPSRSVRELLRTKQLPGYKVGRLWRVGEADLRAWVERRKNGLDREGSAVLPSRSGHDPTRSPARAKGPRAVTVEVRRTPGGSQTDGPSVGGGALPRPRSR
jgi:excisionase family DNA binding protein